MVNTYCKRPPNRLLRGPGWEKERERETEREREREGERGRERERERHRERDTECEGVCWSCVVLVVGM